MSTRSETPTLVATLLVALTLLMGGVWWSVEWLQLGHLLSLGTVSAPGSPPLDAAALAARLSTGDRLLVEAGASPDKHAGVQAIAAGNRAAAIAHLEAAIDHQPTDPEARIYLNNARLWGQPAYSLAVVAPIQTDLDRALEILRGAAQAQQEVNASGGIDGVPLRLVVVDDSEDVAIAAQLADYLIRDQSVLGVVGHTTHATTAAAQARYAAAGLVSISPFDATSPAPSTSTPRFRTVPSNFVTARALANHLLNRLHQSTAAVFYSEASADSRSLRDELATALSLNGGTIVQTYDLAAPAFDPVASVEDAKLRGATALILLPGTPVDDRVFRVIRANNTHLHLLASPPLYTSRTLEVAGPAAVGMRLAIPWHPHTDPDAPFVQRSRLLWQGDVSWRTALTYDAMQALLAAMQPTPTRVGIRQTLQQPEFFTHGATGIVRFLPSGDRNQGIQVVQVQPGFASGFGYDFVPLPLSPAQLPAIGGHLPPARVAGERWSFATPNPPLPGTQR